MGWDQVRRSENKRYGEGMRTIALPKKKQDTRGVVRGSRATLYSNFRGEVSHRMAISCKSSDSAGGPRDIFKVRSPSWSSADMSSPF